MYYCDYGQHQDRNGFLGKAAAAAAAAEVLFGMKSKENIPGEDDGITCCKTKEDGIDGI